MNELNLHIFLSIFNN